MDMIFSAIPGRAGLAHRRAFLDLNIQRNGHRRRKTYLKESKAKKRERTMVHQSLGVVAKFQRAS
jgi:hypothetical protein